MLCSRLKLASSSCGAEQFGHGKRIVDAGLNLVRSRINRSFCCLPHGETAVVSRLPIRSMPSGSKYGGSKTGGPHCQRPARFLHAIVYAFAIGGELSEGAPPKAVHLVFPTGGEAARAHERVGIGFLVLLSSGRSAIISAECGGNRPGNICVAG